MTIPPSLLDYISMRNGVQNYVVALHLLHYLLLLVRLSYYSLTIKSHLLFHLCLQSRMCVGFVRQASSIKRLVQRCPSLS